MGKSIFCIVGETGSGKSFYNNSIVLDKKFMKAARLEPLIYGTTREPRATEVDGLDYNFVTQEEYDSIDQNDLIESRSYYTMNGKKYYFTRRDYITNKKKNLICTSSLYQYESYRNWVANENIKRPGSYNLYLIILYANVKERLTRIINRRCDTDDQVYEACRRIVEEKAEFDQVKARIPELTDYLSYNTVLYINTNDITQENNLINLNKIKQFIVSKTSK